MVKKFKVLFFLFVTIYQVQAQKKEAPKSNISEDNNLVPAVGMGVVQFDDTWYNFGNVSEKGGKVWHDFNFVNSGKGPVRILNVITTCGCTHTDWTKNEVKPGDSGVVRAVYDPNGRLGEIDKSLLVVCDGAPSSQSLKITGMVEATSYNFAETFKYKYGNLAVISNVLTFNSVKNTGYDSTEIGMYNMSNKGIYIYKIDAPANIKVLKPFDLLGPGKDMKLKVLYYPRQPLEYGSIRQEIRVYTSDDTLAMKRFFVSANIVEDFSVLSKKELKKAPKIKLNSNEIDLGKVQYTQTPVATFIINNNGKSDLIIRKVVPGCICLSPELSQTVIPKGKTATLKVSYNLANMAGEDSQTLKLITNDPSQSDLTISVKVYVTE